MHHILVYGDSLSWGIIPNTRRRLSFAERWPGVMEQALVEAGHQARVIEDCHQRPPNRMGRPVQAGAQRDRTHAASSGWRSTRRWRSPSRCRVRTIINRCDQNNACRILGVGASPVGESARGRLGREPRCLSIAVASPVADRSGGEADRGSVDWTPARSGADPRVAASDLGPGPGLVRPGA